MWVDFASRSFFKNWNFFLLAMLFSIYSSGHAAELSSPWDPVPAAHRVASSVECSRAPALSPNLTASGYYEDNASTEVNINRLENYSKATASYRNAAKKIVALADQYRETGDPNVAVCTAKWLERMAKDNVLGGRMKGAQAEYFRAWLLNAYATAWLKIRSGLEANNSARKSVPRWLEGLARGTMAYQSKGDRRNNLRYWAGLAVLSAGIASNNQELFDWGINSYKIGINQIEPDGVLPKEMGRASRARGYHMFAVAPLVMIAELAMANDIDLYEENNRALSRLVAFIVHSIDDPRLIEQRAGVSQDAVPNKTSGMAWLHAYARRFPNPSYASILQRFPAEGGLYLGGKVPF